MLRKQGALIAGLLALIASSPVIGAGPDSNWPTWRGPQDHGSRTAGNLPLRWKPEDVLWKVRLPGKGCSTPIVYEGRIYVTTPAEGRDAVMALDANGKVLWQTEFGKEVPGKHRNASGCNASPVTDGDTIFVYFKSGTFAAVDMDGKIRWQMNLIERFGPEILYWDHGTSPVLTKRHVVMARIHQGDSWLAAFDKKTGKLAWKVARNYKTPREGDHGYTTPLVIEHQGKEAILVWGAQHVTLHDAADGKLIWSCGGFNPEGNPLWPTVASPVVCGDVVVVPFGRNDRGIPRLHGIRVAGEGDVTATHRLWKRTDIGTFVPTPAVYNGHVYVLGDRGRLVCIDPESGKTRWSAQFPKHRSKFYGSPLIVANRLYAVREDGTVFVAKIDPDFELLAENPMGEPIIASPVPLGDRLLLRGWKHLYCVGR
ncbi:MAG TPA: Pyrrolo-quinoline quinone [Planctomycetaceae bacterium]|nr:Pyrrolo-quinoline quinone [Planctomycetaceae bacterium]